MHFWRKSISPQHIPVEIQLGKGTIMWRVKVVNGIPTFDGKTDTSIMGIICANKIDIHLRHCYKFLLFYFKDICFKETNLMTSLLFYSCLGRQF
jgi:hypothetical protein